MQLLLAALLAPFVNAIIRAILGAAAATTTYNWLNDHLKPKFDQLMLSINGAVNDLGSVGGMAGDMYSFLGVGDMLVTITSALSAVLAIKLYVFAIKAFGTNPAAD